jgi:hypothetical protein
VRLFVARTNGLYHLFMRIEEPRKLLHGYWFVAYLDLLGIRRAFLNTDFLPGDDTRRQTELIEALQLSVGAIRRLRSQLAACFVAKDGDRPQVSFAGLPPEKLAESARLQKARVRRDPISDGVVVACPLMPEDGHFPTRGVWDGITACVTLMLVNLAEGRALRGGLDVATAIEIDDELFGAAIVRAYELESKLADYPRLAVGEGLVNYLRASSTAPGAELDRALERKMAPDMLDSFLKRDFDGQWIVDYAGPWARKVFPDQAPALLSAAKAFAHRERERLRAGADPESIKLFGKYSKLVRYLDSQTGA